MAAKPILSRAHPTVLIVNCAFSDDLMVRREFVWPIQFWLRLPSKVIHLSMLKKSSLNGMDAVIFSGSPVKDDYFLTQAKKLAWLKEVKTPLLGVCAGHELLGVIFGGKIQRLKRPVFGENRISYRKGTPSWLLDEGSAYPAYHLNHNWVTVPASFVSHAYSREIPNEVMVHQTKKIMGVQFHPEVTWYNFVFVNFIQWALNYSILAGKYLNNSP